MRFSGLIWGAVLSLWAGMAYAENPLEGDWHVDLSAYVWATSFDGSVTIRGREAPVDSGFIDIIKNADSLVALEGRLGVRKGRIGIYVDGLYNKVGFDDLSGPFGFTNADATATLTYIESAVFYNFLDLPRQLSPDSQDTWNWGIQADVYAGMRYTDIGLELDLKRIGPLRVNQSASRNVDWVDPIVGGRVLVDMSDHWKALLDTNVGGFGVGSQFAFSGMGLVGYEFSLFGLESTVWAGYKGLYQDYQNGSGRNEFRWNMWTHGPIIGSTIRFF
jgi:hypothetical protein